MIPHTDPNSAQSPTFPSNRRRSKVDVMAQTVRAAGPIRAAGYIRVSTDKQAEHGCSLAAQETQIRKWAELHGHELTECFVDGGFSAKNTDRPAFKKMFEQVEAGRLDLIVVSKLDRLTRSIRDFFNLIEEYVSSNKLNIVSISEGINTLNPVSRMIVPILVSVGQIERQQTSDRVKAAIGYIREQGGHYGKVPFGFTTVAEGKLKKLLPHPTEHKWLQQMFSWYAEGKQHTEIARLLNEQGVKPRQSAEWSLDSVRELLCKHGVHKPRSLKGNAIYDYDRAYKMAYQLRADERTLGYIAEQLNKAGLRPKNAPQYQHTSVADLLRSAVYHDRSTAAGYAHFLRSQGHSLRTICEKLTQAGHKPKRGGQWFAQTVNKLLVGLEA